jgi:hypothetical protein
LSGGGIGKAVNVVKGPQTSVKHTFNLQINNFGKTPGEIRKVRYGFLPAPTDNNCLNAPEPPAYSELVYWQDWYKPGQQSRPVTDLDIPAPTTFPTVIFGRLFYRDIFKDSHSCGFALKIGIHGGTGPVRIRAILRNATKKTPIPLSTARRDTTAHLGH